MLTYFTFESAIRLIYQYYQNVIPKINEATANTFTTSSLNDKVSQIMNL